MRVFCPEHNKGFFTPRQSPIRCQSRGHVLGELDFQGTAKGPAEIHWQYCCNCEHFCPTDFSRDGLERCPACTRRTSTLYLCDRCFTVSFESNTPLQTKNFTLTADGAPRPSCPGCLQLPSTDLREHLCDEAGVCFMTALNSCPVCLERLDVGPVFPSTVTRYLRRTKGSSKINVTFDYDSELFVPIEDGEFVLISNPDVNPIVLPRTGRFLSQRDFYELYQDYYHCTDVKVGEVQIIEPAIVEAVGAGWRLQSSGLLEVLADAPKIKAPVNIQPKEVSPVQDTTPPVPQARTEEACPNCGSLVETKYAFCWKCGNSMKPADKKSEPPKPPVRRLQVEEDLPDINQEIGHIQQSILSSVPAWRRFAAEDDESTVQHDKARVRPPSRSWEFNEQPARKTATAGSILKLGGIAAIGFVLISLAVFVLTNSVSQPSLASSDQPAAPAPQQESSPEASITVPAPASAPSQKPVDVQEEELRKLREKRIGAIDSDRQTILRAFARTEKRYPNDYRFPYERAKLALKRREKAARKDAIKALSVAAQKAIRADKAKEMLKGLEADKRGDFQQLANGNRDWKQVVEALKSNDTSLLEPNTQ